MRSLVLIISLLFAFASTQGQGAMFLRGSQPAPQPGAGILDSYLGAAFAAAPDVLIYSSHSVTDNTVGSQTQGQTGQYTVLVRRDNDDALRSFTYTEVSDGTLTAWVGPANNGFVQVLYDQGTNDNHAMQSTAANQPKIVDNGALVVENGKAALDFDGMDDHLSNLTLTASTTQSVFYVKKGIVRAGNSALFGFPTTVSATQIGIYYFNETPSHYGFNTWNNDSWGVSPFTQFTDQTLEFALFKNGNPTTSGVKLFVNGSQLSLSQTKNTSVSRTMANGFRLGSGGSSVALQDYDGLLQEITIYSSDQSANRTAIETAINTEYNIY